jgi:hypothetical protein
MDSVGLDFVELVEAHASDTELVQLSLHMSHCQEQSDRRCCPPTGKLEAIRSAHRLPQPRSRHSFHFFWIQARHACSRSLTDDGTRPSAASAVSIRPPCASVSTIALRS